MLDPCRPVSALGPIAPHRTQGRRRYERPARHPRSSDRSDRLGGLFPAQRRRCAVMDVFRSAEALMGHDRCRLGAPCQSVERLSAFRRRDPRLFRAVERLPDRPMVADPHCRGRWPGLFQSALLRAAGNGGKLGCARRARRARLPQPQPGADRARACGRRVSDREPAGPVHGESASGTMDAANSGPPLRAGTLRWPARLDLSTSWRGCGRR